MLHIVAYDICNARRMKKVAALCLDYGVRVQYSIFEFDLDERLTKRFLSELAALIDPKEDRVMVVPVCESCRKSIRCLGKIVPFKQEELFLV